MVIEIPDRFVKDRDGLFIDDVYKATQEVTDVFFESILKGTPLPEHHSDLIERSSLDVDSLDRAYGPNCELDFGRLYTQDVIEMIEKAPTIIPATDRTATWNTV